MNWQPIETAPKDGTVILTDCGTAVWCRTGYVSSWGIFHDGWFQTDGLSPGLLDDSRFGIQEVRPCYWMPIPQLPQ